LKIKNLSFAIGYLIVCYLLIATIFPSSWLVGEFGKRIGEGSWTLFSFLSYLLPIYLGYCLFAFQNKSKISFERLLAILILFFIFSIFLSLIFNIGMFGKLFISTFKPYIGTIGVVLLLFFIFLISLILLDIPISIVIDFLKEEESRNNLKNSVFTEKEVNKPFGEQKEKEELEEEKPPSKEDKIKEYLEKKLKELHKTEDLIKVKKLEKKESSEDEVLKEKEDLKIEETVLEEKEGEEILELDREEIIRSREENSCSMKDEPYEEEKQEEEEKEIVIKIDIEDYANSIEKEDDDKEVLEVEIIEDSKEEEIEEQEEIIEVEVVEEEVSEVEERESVVVIDKDKELEPYKKVQEEKEEFDIQEKILTFLKTAPKTENYIDEIEIDEKVKLLLDKLKHFKIEGDVVETYSGPIVTTFEFKPLAHIKVSKILNLQDDLAMALRATNIRIQAPIPGKDVVGIEIPNNRKEKIYLREILESEEYKNSTSPLTIALGKDIVGKPFVTDLAKLPHLLIAGTTGSGKSVGMNSMILSLLYRNSPDNLRLMMIDPKMLEFLIYNDIPHLLTPVITNAKKAIAGLTSMLKEMDRRYHLMSKAKVKNIESYNQKFPENKLPYIVVIIDELADLMMTGGKDVEILISRLAQMARASGIHLIVATQRPSVDVVTGLIKANLPSRISFKVGQKIDSKVILDQYGAEGLLGKGDMLFTLPSDNSLIRLHAPFTSEEETENIVEFLKSQRAVQYDKNFLPENLGSDEEGSFERDELYEQAKEIVLRDQKTSISYLQRKLQIGYNRAANIVEQLEMAGVLSTPNTKGQREILI
jgi:S-DNA-T family DNA segregation ATPase FtsK/SpoIIIE